MNGEDAGSVPVAVNAGKSLGVQRIDLTWPATTIWNRCPAFSFSLTVDLPLLAVFPSTLTLSPDGTFVVTDTDPLEQVVV